MQRYRFEAILDIESTDMDSLREIYHFLREALEDGVETLSRNDYNVDLREMGFESDDNPRWQDRVHLAERRAKLVRKIMDGKCDHLLGDELDSIGKTK